MKYDVNHEFVSISSQDATHRIILVHGWGADADDLIPIGKDIAEKTDIKFEIISLRAPEVHPSGSGRQWYDLYPHDWIRAEHEVNKLFLTLKKFEMNNIPLKKTILFGFSQGAAMAIDAGSKLDLGLLILCSGYPHPNWQPPNTIPPIIISHGRMDQVVPINASRKIYESVKYISSNSCIFTEFDGSHQIDNNLINVINLEIQRIF